MTVLAIAPHPDDELIGAGGSLIMHARSGARVVVVHVVGRERTLGGGLSDAEYVAEIAESCARLGAAEVIGLDAPSRDLAATRELRVQIARIVRREQPDVVYVPHAGESDREHALVHQVAMDGLWMGAAGFFPEAGPEPAPSPSLVLGYEVWTPMARYSHVVDITDVIEAKQYAMRAYASQLEHVAWDEALAGLARYRGATAQGGGYAEVFEVLMLRGSPGFEAGLRR